MRIITCKRLQEFGRRYPGAAQPLEKWEILASSAMWRNLQEVRRVYPHADAVTTASGNTVSVFNIGRNKFRFVTAIHYNRQRIYVLDLLTHAQYSKNAWKDRL
jgi:mRNA interferase HigB